MPHAPAMTKPDPLRSTPLAEPQLPAVVMHAHTPANPALGTVVGSHRCSASRKAAGFVRHVSIDVSGTELAGRFVAGQSFGVLAPGQDAKGKPHQVRLYSIASPSFGEDGSGNVLATTCKRLIDEDSETGKLFLGVASNYLCDLQVGDRVRVTGPNGKRFVLPECPEKHDYLFLATGTGIAPFRGMLKELYRHPTRSRADSQALLVLGAPYTSDLLYHDELESLEASEPSFTYLTAISRESQDVPGPSGSSVRRPLYVQDRLVLSEQARAMLASERTLIYVCGIAGMELGIFQALARSLPADVRDQYFLADDATLADVDGWDKKMIHRQVKPTRRVFLETY